MQSPWFIGAVNTAIIGTLVVITIIGLGVGKWVHKVGAALMLAIFAAIIILPLLNLAHGSITEYHPLAIEMPVMSLLTFNLLGKMGFGALGGFEYVAIHAGESRDPVRTIGRSVAIAAPIVAVMFIMGTSSVLSLIPQDQIDLIAPIPQILSVGFGPLGVVAAIVPLTIVAMLSIRLAQSSVQFGGNTRLPMVAGWDNLLPAWFTKIHAKYKTPVNSILFVGSGNAVYGHRRADRRRQAGGISTALERLGRLLRAHISRDVRDTAHRPACIGSENTGLVENCGLQRLCHDAAIRRPLDRADRTGREPAYVRRQDRRPDRGDKSDRGTRARGARNKPDANKKI